MPTKKQEELLEDEITASEASQHQTDSDNDSKNSVTDEESRQLAGNAPNAQTEKESGENSAPSECAQDPTTQNDALPQTETETPKKTRRLKADQADTEPQQRNTRPRTKPNETVVAIDDRPTVETDAEKAQNDLLDLIESLKTGRILTGTIQGVEQSTETPNTSLAVIYHGEFKIIIPVAEMITPPDDYRGRNPNEIHHYMLTKRLGAEIDYIVKGIDPNADVAVASRLEAMRARRKEFYFGTDRDGNNLIYEGVCAEARVVSVIRAGIFIDLFGLEVYIPLRELSYQRWMDAGAHFQPGQRVLVKVINIDRNDRYNIKVSASVKQAGENPYEKALRKYTVGNRYVGTVSIVDINGVFVALDGGIDCLCTYPKRGRPPRGARVTVRILGINHETNRIWGAITHITTPR